MFIPLEKGSVLDELKMSRLARQALRPVQTVERSLIARLREEAVAKQQQAAQAVFVEEEIEV